MARSDLEDVWAGHLLDALNGGAKLFLTVGCYFQVERLVLCAVAHLLVPALGGDACTGCDLNLPRDS